MSYCRSRGDTHLIFVVLAAGLEAQVGADARYRGPDRLATPADRASSRTIAPHRTRGCARPRPQSGRRCLRRGWTAPRSVEEPEAAAQLVEAVDIRCGVIETSAGSSWITLRGGCDSFGGLGRHLLDGRWIEQLTPHERRRGPPSRGPFPWSRSSPRSVTVVASAGCPARRREQTRPVTGPHRGRRFDFRGRTGSSGSQTQGRPRSQRNASGPRLSLRSLNTRSPPAWRPRATPTALR
jgi:hypothetical protein